MTRVGGDRVIDPVPADERTSRAGDLFTMWFGANCSLLAITTGALAVSAYRLPLAGTVAALLLGNLVGGVVTALHAAQGPRTGVTQMVQARAQFGSLGSLLVVGLVVLMFVGFLASNLALGAQTLVRTAGGSSSGALGGLVVVVLGVVVATVSAAGQRYIRAAARVLVGAAVAATLLCLAGILLTGATVGSGAFTGAGFAAVVSVAALWQIAFAPYVSDYSRYLPAVGGPRAAFRGTLAGTALGATVAMTLGALLGSTVPGADGVTGMMALPGGTGRACAVLFALVLMVSSCMNVHGGALCVLSVGQTLRPAWRPGAAARWWATAATAAVAVAVSTVGRAHFLAVYHGFLLVLLCVLVPWAGVNLTDFFLVRRGEYDLVELGRADGGRYGRVNRSAVGCYLVGVLVQVPFLSTTAYTGPIAVALHGVDVSWIVALATVCPLYLVLGRRGAGDRRGVGDGGRRR